MSEAQDEIKQQEPLIHANAFESKTENSILHAENGIPHNEEKSKIDVQKYINPHSYTLGEKIEILSDNLMRGYFVGGAVLGALGVGGIVPMDYYANPIFNYAWNYLDGMGGAIGFFNKRKSWKQDHKVGLKPSLGEKAVAGYDMFAAVSLLGLNTLSVLHYVGIFSDVAFSHLGSAGFALSMSASFVHATKDAWVAHKLLNDPKYLLEDILQRYQSVKRFLDNNPKIAGTEKELTEAEEQNKKQAEAEMQKLLEQAKALASVKFHEIGQDNITTLFQTYAEGEQTLREPTLAQKLLVESLLEQQREKKTASLVNAAGYFGATAAFSTTVGFTGIGLNTPELTGDYISSLGQMALFALAFAGAIKLCQLIACAYSLRDEHKNGREAFLNQFEINRLQSKTTFFTENNIPLDEEKKYLTAWEVNKHKILKNNPNDLTVEDNFYQQIQQAPNKNQLLNAAVDDFRMMQFLIDKGTSPKSAAQELENLLKSHGDRNARHFLLKATVEKNESNVTDAPKLLATA